MSNTLKPYPHLIVQIESKFKEPFDKRFNPQYAHDNVIVGTCPLCDEYRGYTLCGQCPFLGYQISFHRGCTNWINLLEYETGLFTGCFIRDNKIIITDLDEYVIFLELMESHIQWIDVVEITLPTAYAPIFNWKQRP